MLNSYTSINCQTTWQDINMSCQLMKRVHITATAFNNYYVHYLSKIALCNTAYIFKVNDNRRKQLHYKQL